MSPGESGPSRTQFWLMVAGGVVVVIAGLLFLTRDTGDGTDEAAAEATRCAFPACRAAFNPEPSRAYEGQSVAVNPTDHDHIVVTDANLIQGHCTYHVTFNRGKEWTDGVFVLPPGYTGCLINGAAGGHVPTGTVAFGPSGNVYATFGSSTGEDAERESVIIGTSTDGGKAFRTQVAARPPADSDLSYARPLLGLAPAGAAGAVGASGPADKLYASFWLCRERGRFCEQSLLVRSTDGGSTFSQPVTVNDSPAGQSPSEPLVAPDGTIYVTYARRYDDGPSDVLLAKSTDGGVSFTSAVIERQPKIGDQFDPAKLAFDPASGALYITYTDARSGRQQVVFRKSTDKGVNWSQPIGLSPDAGASGEGRVPSIGVAPNGRIDIVYYRLLGENDDVFWSFSVDGGNRFLTRQVNEKPISRKVGYSREVGNWYPPDVASIDEAAVVVWSDTGEADPVTNTQDVLLRRMSPSGQGGDLPP